MTSANMLDPVQRRAIDLCCTEGNCLITGEAGTGKSVVLAHAVAQYAIKHPGVRMCAVTYTNSLVALLEHDLARYKIPVMTIHALMSLCKKDRTLRYDCIFVDEVQDCDPRWARVLLKHSNKFVLVGDFGQCIYEELHPVISRAKLLEMFDIAPERILNLTVDHRLPKNCRLLVEKIFLERHFDSDIDKLLANAEVSIFKGSDWEDERNFVISKARATARPGAPSVIVLESKRRIFSIFHTIDPSFDGQKIKPESVNDKLREHDLPFRFLGGGFGDIKESDSRALTYLMTWHSSKGLDFETVIVPDLGNAKCRPNLFYVALTRSRRNLILAYSGQSDQIDKALQCDFVRVLQRDIQGRVMVAQKKIVQRDLFDGNF